MTTTCASTLTRPVTHAELSALNVALARDVRRHVTAMIADGDTFVIHFDVPVESAYLFADSYIDRPFVFVVANERSIVVERT